MLSEESNALPPVDSDALTRQDAAQMCGELASRLGRVEEQLADFHRRAAHRESVIDRLHEENQQLRAGRTAILEPVIADLIRLYDQLTGRPAGSRPPGRTGG